MQLRNSATTRTKAAGRCPASESIRNFSATTTAAASPLVFNRITLADLPAINSLLTSAARPADLRTCDYSIGGLYMWIDYFNYRFCIYRNTLFISGVSEQDGYSPAFSLPIGELPLEESTALLADYCRHRGYPLRFSAIPEMAAARLEQIGCRSKVELTDWADYLYDIADLATLRGKRYNKKRNHVNRFIADHPNYELVDITASNCRIVASAYKRMCDSEIEIDHDDDLLDFSGFEEYLASKSEEQSMTAQVLANLAAYPFEGAFLTDETGRIVAFTLAEIIGDTACIHIEKMDHNVAGAGETINKLFAERLAQRHPGLRYLNREEDCGDPDLRYTKQSYHPSALLRKFDLVMAD